MCVCVRVYSLSLVEIRSYIERILLFIIIGIAHIHIVLVAVVVIVHT